MEAIESKIIDILTETKRYIIPSYQRPYSWSDEHVTKFIEDIHESFTEKRSEYFIGSLICIDKGKEEYEVVDGQQRLTTLTLLFRAIENQLPNTTHFKQALKNRFLPQDEFSGVATEPRIKIRKKESDLYKNYILQGDKSFLPEENKRTYTENLFINNTNLLSKYLTDNLSNDKELPKLAEYILKNIYVVLVKTENFASSYRLFNVLNTRGLSLTQADLLKNNIFEILENNPNVQAKAEGYWNEIESIVGIENMDKFLIIHEISQKNNRNIAVPIHESAEIIHNRIKGVYKNNAEEFILELKKSAENYQRIKEADFTPKLNKIFRCLLQIQSEWIPPVLAFLNKLNTQNTVLKETELDEFIVNFEKVYIHRWFAKHIKSRREVVCSAAIADINNNKTTKNIIETIKTYSDNDSLNNYFTNDIPKSNKTYLTKYVLLRIEESMQDNSVSKSYHGTITIEHVLPRTISDKYWTDRFSKEKHADWVNKIGNLTLLSGSKNSKAQNSNFNKKLKVYNASNNKVSFDITKEIMEHDNWGLEELKARHSKLLQRAREIWFVN